MQNRSDSQGAGGPPFSSEQRRSPRYPVFLDALVTGEGLESRACKIRDFCAQGIFLSFEGEDSGVVYASQRPIRVDERVDVHFFTPVGGQHKGFELHARVVRVLTSGIGAELITPEPAAIAALMEAAKATAVQAEPAVPQGRSAPREEGKVERMALLKELRGRLQYAHEQWMMRLYSGLDNVILNASREAVEAVAQRSIWQAGQLLKERRPSVVADLRAALLEVFDAAATRGVAPSAAGGQGQDGAPGDLSLVETDEFEQFLAVSEEVDRAETMLGRSTFELNQRLSYMFGARIDKGNNPIGPAALARQFGNYMRRMRLGVEPLRATLRAFHELVVPEIQNFYEDANRYLAQCGVPLVGETPRPRIISSAPARRPPPQQAAAGASAHAHVAGGGDVAEQLRQLTSTLPPGTPLMVAPVSAFQAAHTLFGLGRELQKAPAVEAVAAQSIGPATSLAYYNTGELASAFNAMEASLAEAAVGMTPQALRGRLERALAAQGVSAAPKRVKESDWELVQLVMELFNAVLADPHVIPEIRPHLRKLRAPVNRVALADSSFFEEAAHPARRIINNLTRVRSVSRDNGRESILPHIDFIVDRVASESAQRPEVFAEAGAELEAILAEQEREAQANLDKLVQSAEAQQQIMRARRKEGTGDRLSSSASLGGDWVTWLNRARRLQVGDELLLGKGTQQQLAHLAWVSDDGNSYVFADRLGRRLGSFGAQELAMQLRRGTALPIEDMELPAVERAMLKSLESLHGQLEKQVHADAVTSLLNEKAFSETIEQALLQARQDKESHVLALLAVEAPATVQQPAGTVSEEHLRAVVARFRDLLPAEAVAARLANDQFGLLFRSCSQGQGYTLLERILAAVRASPGQADAPTVRARAGLTPFGAEALTGVRVLKAAQTALSLASAGGSAIRIVHVEEDDATGARVSSRLTEQLQQALDNERLQLALQRITPQLQPSAADLPTHIEMMPSMQTDGGIRVSAKALRIAAEQSERSKDLDRWLIRRVMRWMVEHPEQLPTQGVCIIGLSMASLKDASLPGFISEELINTSAPPGRLCFEVMEEQELGGNPEVEELVYSLREYGCRFLYGDFGGESSSFSRVKTLKVDMVRIGRMQSRDIVSDRGDAALVKSVIEMAHFLGIPAIADNINSKPMLTKLRELGIEYAQGTATSPVELAI